MGNVYVLAAPFSVPNPSRFEVLDAREVKSDPNTVTALVVELEFRTVAGSDRQYGKYVVIVRNGRSTQLKVRSPYPAGMALQDMLEMSEESLANPLGGVATPTGLDTALAAWRSGALAARKGNLLTELKNLNVIDQAGALAGSVP